VKLSLESPYPVLEYFSPKTPSESFDGAQDERRGFDTIGDFPFMLRPSKHSEPFLSNLLT
jgi:hypothetical protein